MSAPVRVLGALAAAAVAVRVWSRSALFRDGKIAPGRLALQGLAFAKSDVQPVHTEFRDDRFSAAFERSSSDKPVFSVAYVVRAVSPGRYVVPQAYVEDMYRPDRFGRTGTRTIEIATK